MKRSSNRLAMQSTCASASISPRKHGIRSPVRVVLAAVAILTIGACASTAGTGQFAGGDASVLSETEIRSASTTNLLDVVERLRPLWLRTGPARSANLPTEIVVIVNDMYFGDVESLSTIPSETVVRMSYLDAASATARHPGIEASRHVAGAIVVQLARP